MIVDETFDVESTGVEPNNTVNVPINVPTQTPNFGHSKKRKKYSLTTKQEMIEQVDATKNQSEVARINGIDRRLICEWYKQKDVISKTKFKRRKTRILTKKDLAKYPEMENELLAWFDLERLNKRSVSGLDIKHKALEIHQRIYSNILAQNPFQASDGWLYGWLERNNKTYRRVTTTGRDLPNNYMQIIADFLTKSIEVLRKTNWNRSKIFNMDETSIYLDCPSRYTFTDKGAKRVKVDTNGAEMVRISAAFTASACGNKLPIYLIIPRTNELENYTPPANIRILYKSTTTFNEDTICEYLETIMSNRKGSYLYLDSARCHITTSVKDMFNRLDLEQFIIPPRMTNILQPADVSWFAKVKKAYCAKWSQWSRNSPKTYTIHGNSKSPGYVLAIQWLSEIWDDFDESLIIDSFDSCGITGQSHLHSTLKNLVNNNLIFNSYIDDLEEEEDILGLDNVDEIDVNLRELVLEENTSIEANQSSPEQLITSPEQSQIQSYQNPPNSTPINIQTPETDENVNQIGTPVTSNEAQPRLNGRYVLKELNNQQNVNQPNVSNSSSITIQKLPKKRGRKPLPRDENGKIIRQQNL